MGQYYKAISQKGHGKIAVYSRDVIVSGKKEYTPAKLTEHSWWFNPFVNAICIKLCKNKLRIAWIGDYANDYYNHYSDRINDLSKKKIERLHTIAWREKRQEIAVKDNEYTLNNQFLINHTKGEYIDCSAYYKRCIIALDGDIGWCLHPLPLLTCIGNGLGGGDYNNPTDDSDTELVGTWAYDEISVEDTIPDNYIELEPLFKEKGWD